MRVEFGRYWRSICVVFEFIFFEVDGDGFLYLFYRKENRGLGKGGGYFRVI